MTIINDVNYNDVKTVWVLKKLNISIDDFKEYVKCLDNILSKLKEVYGGNMYTRLYLEKDKLYIKFYWDYDIFKNSAEYKCGDWSKEWVLEDFFEDLLRYIYLPIARSINIIIEKDK